MNIHLHSIARRDDGQIEVAVSFGNAAPTTYEANLTQHERGSFTTIDEGLFMKLSDFAYERFGNCTIYQSELMRILRAFQQSEPLPDLPVELGSTRFCCNKPGFLQVLYNRWLGFI